MKELTELNGLYSVQKTLRFELKPIGKTLEHINKKGLITQDKQREEDYKKAKDIIDRYHKDFIDTCLEKCNFEYNNNEEKDPYKLSKNNLEEYAELLSRRNRDSEDEDRLETLKEQLRNQIAKAFKHDKNFDKMFKKELFKELLPNFLEHKEEKKVIEDFSKFTTYFSGFHDNRKNMYSNEAKTTAIAYRLIHENFPRFNDNIHSFQQIADNNEVANHFTEIQSAFSSNLHVEHIQNMFELDYFSVVLTQSQIDVYNKIIGGKSESKGTKVKGINEYVNLYNQQHPDNKLPLLKPLYKMILSDRKSLSWLPEEFESDDEMIKAINDYWNTIQPVLDRVSQLIGNIADYDINRIYITNDTGLTHLSQQLFGQYDAFTVTIKENLANNTPRKPKEERHPDLYEERIDGLFKKVRSFSINYLNSLINDRSKTIESYFSRLGAFDRESKAKIDLLAKIRLSYNIAQHVLEGKYTDINQSEEATKAIKDFLDAFKSLQHFIKPLLGSGEEADKDNEFYALLLNIWEELDAITPLYNKVRNWLTRKPYSTNKIRLNFINKGNFLEGWVDSSSENSDNGTQYGGYIFRKKNIIGEYDYYLGISADSKLFRRGTTNQSNEGIYERLDYYQLKKNSFFESKYSGNYKEDTQAFFEACKKSLTKINSDSKHFPKIQGLKKPETLPAYLRRIKSNDHIYKTLMKNKKVKSAYDNIKSHILQTLASVNRIETAINLSKHNEYNLDELFDKIEEITSTKSFGYFPVSTSMIEEANKRENKPLYLFKISNKDLSFAESYSKGTRKKRGTENLHTLYFRELLNPGQGVYDLGNGSVFFRESTTGLKESTTIHKAHKSIANKNTHNEKKSSIFDYDIIKYRRYIYDKFLFHLSIKLNYSKPEKLDTNSIVQEIIRNHGIKHIIGIDRGERHLLYLSLIDLNGNIVKQMTLNEIKQYKEEDYGTNYKELLATREGNRAEARRNWKKIENIKDLKMGYLSQVVHVISQMMVEYKAIVILEDLNMGFMQSRQKIERNVYEQFEHMLIDKLNFYVDKKKEADSPGGLLHGLQLANRFESFSKLGKQSGCLFYVPAWNTSKIAPVTGFVNLRLNPRYENIEQAQKVFSKFDRISFNEEKNWIEFDIDYTKFGVTMEGVRTHWTLCTYGNRIKTFRNPSKLNQWDNEEIILTDKFKKVFADAGIDIHGNLKESICSLSEREYLKELMDLMKLLLQMRNSISNSETDYIISPVLENGTCYDSRCCNDNLPKDADANGAYNIARKGLWVLRKIQQSKPGDKLNLALSNKEWLQFVQDKSNFQ